VSNEIISILIQMDLASLDELDAFHSESMAPHGSSRGLKSNFFNDRHQAEKGGHLKGFAAEMLVAIKILCTPAAFRLAAFPTPPPKSVRAGGFCNLRVFDNNFLGIPLQFYSLLLRGHWFS
jgi:hypothetical protein